MCSTDRGGGGGPAEEEALHEGSAEGAGRLEFVLGLDALVDALRTDVAGEGGEGLRGGAAHGVVVEAADDGGVEFDHVRLDLDELTQARVAGADVVDGDGQARGAQVVEGEGELVVVAHQVVFGDLDDHPPLRGQGQQQPGEIRRHDGAGGDVDGEERVRLEVVGGEHGALHGRQLEGGLQAGRGGVGEPRLRGAVPGGEAGEGFVPGHGPVGDADDGLEHDRRAPVGEEVDEVVVLGASFVAFERAGVPRQGGRGDQPAQDHQARGAVAEVRAGHRACQRSGRAAQTKGFDVVTQGVEVLGHAVGAAEHDAHELGVPDARDQRTGGTLAQGPGQFGHHFLCRGAPVTSVDVLEGDVDQSDAHGEVGGPQLLDLADGGFEAAAVQQTGRGVAA